MKALLSLGFLTLLASLLFAQTTPPSPKLTPEAAQLTSKPVGEIQATVEELTKTSSQNPLPEVKPVVGPNPPQETSANFLLTFAKNRPILATILVIILLRALYGGLKLVTGKS